ncbi:MAG: hypothetical protein M1370_05060 [Bacteroidetes bacterium]|nr:hypothetical protein [Bacteroidota bacterium]
MAVSNEVTTIHRERLLTNDVLAARDPDVAAWFSRIGINPSKHTIELSSGRLLIIDPTYLADIYNENGPKEQYLKESGVLLTDFGGDVSGQAFRTRCGGIKILLVFDRTDDEGRPVFRQELAKELSESEIDSENLGCDSGSYLFLDYNQELKSTFDDELRQHRLFVVELQPGRYGVGYEQWEVNAENAYESWRRNLVVWPA